ncbi:MAG: aminotransferase class I/II-fold pyridoxal phosphate-dependent enzyme [Pirellulaceae bacterium]|nr:aminotransferase class I/II-fold pyridoxal phosphate-dependent enzyme [Pirellulaceae bacterium]
MSTCTKDNQASFKELFAGFEPPMTHLVDHLKYWAQTLPDTLAFGYLADGESVSQRLTYSQLETRAKSIAVEIEKRGLRGDRVLLLYPPCIDFIEAFFAIQLAGAIPVPAYPPRKSRNGGRIDLIAQDADAKLIMTNRETITRMKNLLAETECLKHIPLVASEEIPNEYADDFKNLPISIDDVGLLQYTSGSTGSPKGVVLTHRNLMESCKMITRAFKLYQHGSGVSWLPTYHDMGLVGGILNPLFIGCPKYLMPPLAFLAKPVRWLRAISELRTNIAGGPNFAYQLCVDKISEEEAADLDLSCWEVAFNGAEPIRPETLAAFNAKFAPNGFRPTSHYPCYGMAETTLLVTGGDSPELPLIQGFDRQALDGYKAIPVGSPKGKDTFNGNADLEKDNVRDLVACGFVQPHEKIIIVDPKSFELLEDGLIGEIWINGVTVGQGYWNKPEESAECFEATCKGSDEHFLRTGDLGFFFNDQIFVTGRLKDLIIIRGVNRYPQDIEATVENASTRLQNSGSAAFSVDVQGSERLVIVSETERSRDKNWSTVIDDVRKAVIAEHDVPPDAVVMVRASSIQKTSSGKIQRHACKSAFLEGSLRVIDKWIGWEDSAAKETDLEGVEDSSSSFEADLNHDVLKVVFGQIRVVARDRAKNVTADTNIVIDLGLDSLERLQIANNLEQIYGARFPDEVIQDIETVREIVEAIQENFDVSVTVSDGSLPTPTAKRIDGEIPEEFYLFEKVPEVTRFKQEKKLIDNAGVRNPFFSVHEGTIGDQTQIAGRKLISFASYNYVGLNGYAEVKNAAKAAIDEYGTSVSASRLVSGEKAVHRQFESELKDFLRFEDALLLTGGHATNQSVVGHLVGRGDLILHDALAHNSIIQGAMLSGATRRPFDHNDWEILDQILREIRRDYRRVLIAIEGLYSMDGDFPDLPKFVEVKKRHKCLLYVDEAHSIGTLGETGRGLTELQDVNPDDIDFCMGTVSKSLGSFGGFVLSNSTTIDYLRYTTPGFVFAAGLPPGAVAAGFQALKVLRKEPGRVANLAKNSQMFLELANRGGLNTGPSGGSPIIPVITGDSLKALKLSESLYLEGINAQPILHPAVEEDRARVRFFMTSLHTPEQIQKTVDVTVKAWNVIKDL